MAVNKRELLAALLQGSGANGLLTRTAVWRGLLVLNYHRIGAPGGTCFDPGLFSASEDQFADQVRYLTRHFDVVGVRDLPEVLRNRRGRFVMITFDDGYADNYEAAFPILRAYGATAVWFLATGFLDDGGVAWWDEISWMVQCSTRRSIALDGWLDERLPLDRDARGATLDRLLRTYKSLPGRKSPAFLESLADACGTGRCPRTAAAALWMTWDQVREMHAAGMQFGGHTVAHPVLSRLSEDEQLYEITECKRRIEAELGRPVTAFSYPVGQRDSFNETTRSLLQDAGYEFAFSYYGGWNRPGHAEPYDLQRAAVESHVTQRMFRSMMSLPQLFAR